MAIPKALTKVLDGCRGLSIVADGDAIRKAGIGLAAAGVSWPVLAAGAAGVLAYAGYSVWRDTNTDKKLSKIHDIGETLRDVAARMETSQREDARQAFALADVLKEAMRDPAARELIPEQDGTDPLAAMLKLIRAEGKEREKLLEENKAVVDGLNVFITQQFDGIRDTFDLVQADLDAITTQLREIRTDIDITQWLIERQHRPPLYTPKAQTGPLNRFKYIARRVKMYGRKAETDELWGFLTDTAPFLWSAWTGLAGTGKSRLALEFCEEAQEEGWDAKFFDWDTDEAAKTRWDFWSPTKPTLVVFDYVYEYDKSIRRAIRTMSRYRSTLVRPVRFLLLERPPPAEAHASWWQTILDAGHGEHEGVVAATCHDRDDEGAPHMRSLFGLSPEATIEILRDLGTELAGDDGSGPDDAELARQLEQIEVVDELRRPLITAFAAEALAEGKLQPQWSATDLVKHMLDKERVRWRTTLEQAGVSERDTGKWINLLMLGTLCGGVRTGAFDPKRKPGEPPENGDPVALFELPVLSPRLPTARDYDDGSLLAMLASGADDNTLPKLEPDMLGECFVLESLKKWTKLDQALVEAAWQADPKGIGDFLNRAANSFPLHDTLDRLLAVPTGEGGDNKPRLHSLMRAAMASADRLLGLPRTKRPGIHMRVHDLVVRLYQFEGMSRYLLWNDAIALCNEHRASEAGSVTAERLLTELRSLSTSHPKDATVRKQLASSLFAAFSNSVARSVAAERLLTELRTLWASHEDDASVRESLARALYNAYCDSEAGSAASERLLIELRSLSASYPEDAEVQECLAAAVCNACYRSTTGSGASKSLLAELRSLSASHPENAAIREPLARALANAASTSDVGSVAAGSLLTELRSLSASHPEDAAVRKQLAGVQCSVFRDSEAGTFDVEPLLTELRSLSASHPEDAAVRKQLAWALFGAFRDSEARSVDAERLLTELRTLSSSHPEDAEVQKWLAEALCIAFWDSDSESVVGERLLTELRSLSASNPEDATVREQLAKALLRAFDDSEAGSAASEYLLIELLSLPASHAEDAGIREWLAKILCNAFLKSEAGSTAAQSLFANLRSLHTADPQHPTARLSLAKALLSKAARAAADGDIGTQCALLEELSPFADVLLADDASTDVVCSVLSNAVELAINAHDQQAFRRIQAVRKAIFPDA